MSSDTLAVSTGKRPAPHLSSQAEEARRDRRQLQPSNDRPRQRSNPSTAAKFWLGPVSELKGDVPELWDCWLEAIDEETKTVYMYGGSPDSQNVWSPILWACDFTTMKWTNMTNALAKKGGMFASRSTTAPLPAIREPGDMLFLKFANSKFLLVVGGTIPGQDSPGSQMRLVVIDLTSLTWYFEPIEGSNVPTRHDVHCALVKYGPDELPRIFIFGGKDVETDEYIQTFCSAVADPTSQGWRWDLVDQKLPAVVPKLHSSTVVVAVRDGKSILITRGWPMKGSKQNEFDERSLVEYLVDSGQFVIRACVKGDFPTKFDVLSLSTASKSFGESAFLASVVELSAENPNPLPEIHQYSWDRDGSTTIRCLNARRALQRHADSKKWQIHATYFFSDKCFAIGSQSATRAHRTRWNLAIECSLKPEGRSPEVGQQRSQ